MNPRRVPDKFLVAFSFAGEQRDLVRSVAEAVEKQLGPSSVFLDEWFQHYIAGDNADLRLKTIYGQNSVLVVVCVSKNYGNKPWTQAEHASVRARLMATPLAHASQPDSVLPIRVGEGDVPGIEFTTIVPDIRTWTIPDVANLILARLYLIHPLVEGCGFVPSAEARTSSATSAESIFIGTFPKDGGEALPSAKARAIFCKIVAVVNQLLTENEQLRAEIEAAVVSNDRQRLSDARDIVDWVFAFGLQEVLFRIFDWLKNRPSRKGNESEIQQIIEGLIVLGINADWVESARRQIESGSVAIPVDIAFPEADIVVAALMNRRTQLEGRRKPGFREGKTYIPVTGPEPAGTTRQQSLAEVRGNLMRCLPSSVLTGNSAVDEARLSQHLRTYRRLGSPFYTILDEKKDAELIAAIDREKVRPGPSLGTSDEGGGFDWRLLLILKRESQPLPPKVSKVLDEPQTVTVLVNEILDHLDTLAAKAKPRYS